jgi:hypothetical protein
MDLSTLREFEDDTRAFVPGFSVKWKTDSLTQKLLGWVLFFNPKYMTGYITTFYPSVYFPSKDRYESNPTNSLQVLAHERVHLMDSVRYGMWFKFSYLLPQVLFVPLLLASIACLIGHLKLASLILLALGLVALIPWPSPWRVNWEKRGYAMTLATNYWIFGSIPEPLKQSVRGHFLDWSYFKMSRNQANIDAWLSGIVASIEDGTICSDGAYYHVHKFLSDKGLVQR